jgi:hypothetical protein
MGNRWGNSFGCSFHDGRNSVHKWYLHPRSSEKSLQRIRSDTGFYIGNAPTLFSVIKDASLSFTRITVTEALLISNRENISMWIPA